MSIAFFYLDAVVTSLLLTLLPIGKTWVKAWLAIQTN